MYFVNCQTVEEAKKQYRKLVMKHHPDHGGNSEEFKAIQAEFEKLLESFIYSSFSNFEKDTERTASGNPTFFAEILKSIIDFNITIRVIGYWIYAFDSYEYRKELKDLGFWFSKKHKAWVYSGDSKKKKKATKYSLGHISSYYGESLIKEREKRRLLI